VGLGLEKQSRNIVSGRNNKKNFYLLFVFDYFVGVDIGVDTVVDFVAVVEKAGVVAAC
tara:strand:- start:277 stop:450 length:174 start_codon:yes stop_codon:yes gene_type:complete